MLSQEVTVCPAGTIFSYPLVFVIVFDFQRTSFKVNLSVPELKNQDGGQVINIFGRHLDFSFPVRQK